MEYTRLTVAGNGVQGLSQEQTHSLYAVCKQIGDKRAARGKQYDLAGLLMVLVLAKLAGMKSLLGASDWGRDQAERLREHLKLSWKQMPCANTSKYALTRLDSQLTLPRVDRVSQHGIGSTILEKDHSWQKFKKSTPKNSKKKPSS